MLEKQVKNYNAPPAYKGQGVFRALKAIGALILREMLTTYGRSPGGYIWAIIEPAVGIVILAFLFSIALRQPPLGTNFALFYATGLIPLMMYLNLVAKISTSITYSKQLLFYPAVTFMDALLARFILAAVTQILVFILIIYTIILTLNLSISINFNTLFEGLCLALMLGFSLGTMNCLISSFFPLWLRIWSIANRPMFILSCTLFLLESVPQPYQDILWYNPVVHMIGLVRKSFYPYYAADYINQLYVYGICFSILTISVFFLYRYHRDIINF